MFHQALLEGACAEVKSVLDSGGGILVLTGAGYCIFHYWQVVIFNSYLFVFGAILSCRYFIEDFEGV